MRTLTDVTECPAGGTTVAAGLTTGDGTMTTPCECGRKNLATDYVDARTQRIRPHSVPEPVVDLTARRRRHEAKRLANVLATHGVSADQVPTLSGLTWELAGTIVGLASTPDAETRVMVALALRVPELAG